MPKAVVALDQNVEGIVDPTAEPFSDQLDRSDLAACEDLTIDRSPERLLSISTASVGLCLGGPLGYRSEAAGSRDPRQVCDARLAP